MSVWQRDRTDSEDAKCLSSSWGVGGTAAGVAEHILAPGPRFFSVSPSFALHQDLGDGAADVLLLPFPRQVLLNLIPHLRTLKIFTPNKWSQLCGGAIQASCWGGPQGFGWHDEGQDTKNVINWILRIPVVAFLDFFFLIVLQTRNQRAQGFVK